jgi:hypothetical protein
MARQLNPRKLMSFRAEGLTPPASSARTTAAADLLLGNFYLGPPAIREAIGTSFHTTGQSDGRFVNRHIMFSQQIITSVNVPFNKASKEQHMECFWPRPPDVDRECVPDL